MLNGIDLFSGYGGITSAVSEWIRPVIYCEIEPYSQGMLLSSMDDGTIPFAPIWNDVTTLDGTKFRNLVDAVVGGFPCQGNSVAGKGLGLADERTGLFHQIIRIAEESRPTFIFLENVAGIRTKESFMVKSELARIGYDCRWGVISASEIGANHKRERYFCLAAYSERVKLRDESWWRRWTSWKTPAMPRNNGVKELMANANGLRKSSKQSKHDRPIDCGQNLAHSDSERLEGLRSSERVQSEQSGPDCIGDAVSQKVANSDLQRCRREADAESEKDNERVRESYGWPMSSAADCSWWKTEPDVGRVANGVELRAHRIKALGNGVVPLQVKTAFKILMGIK